MGKSYTSKGGNLTPYDFELDGVKFVCTGGVSMLDVSELAGVGGEDVDSIRGVAAMHRIYRSSLEDDYDRFAAHVRKHITDPETMFEILSDYIEQSGLGPTAPSQPSPAGRLNTRGSSMDDLAWPGLPQREAHEFTDEEIASIRRQLAGGV